MQINRKFIELGFIVAALVDAIYLSIEHFFHGILSCSASGLINCQLVLTSRFSTIFGIPIAFMALTWSILLFAVVYLGLKNKAIVYALLTVGALGVIYSITAQWSLGHICEYCTVLDVLIAIIIAIHTLMADKHG